MPSSQFTPQSFIEDTHNKHRRQSHLTDYGQAEDSEGEDEGEQPYEPEEGVKMTKEKYRGSDFAVGSVSMKRRKTWTDDANDALHHCMDEWTRRNPSQKLSDQTVSEYNGAWREIYTDLRSKGFDYTWLGFLKKTASIRPSRKAIMRKDRSSSSKRR
ncbi:hypothetical protein FRB95_001403 [Tulasnella sp. JGI-2019a]|nr:hypothetical protein FRB95_001403 [Tulasnella sp. JGI-2019a]